MPERHDHEAAPLAASDPPQQEDAALAVFGPAPVLTITIEAAADRPAVHLHPGGQGFWVARLAATLGARVTLCCALGGESGDVLRSLIESEPITLRAAATRTPNGVYVHDRRSGERVEVVNVDGLPLDRHAADALYGIALAAGLDADVSLLAGCHPPGLVSPDLYRRLAHDLRANGKTVIADLTGPPLEAVLDAGIELLKLSGEELVAERFAATAAVDELLAGARELHARGARHVLVSRGAAPSLLVGEAGSHVLLRAPTFETVDAHGTGDSMFAACAVGLARGLDVTAAARIGMAAGALNVTRHGLGTGTRQEIELLAAHVDVEGGEDADTSS